MSTPKLLGLSTYAVLAQFSCSSVEAVPAGLLRRENETQAARDWRKGTDQVAGELVIDKIPAIDLRYLRRDLENAGWYLVDGSYQMRINVKRGGTYPAVRFIFSRDQDRAGDLDPEFRKTIIAAFDKMATEAFWRVRATLNTAKIPGTHRASINFEARTPISDAMGNPILARRVNERGEKVGEPLPIAPKGTLRVVGYDLKIV